MVKAKKLITLAVTVLISCVLYAEPTTNFEGEALSKNTLKKFKADGVHRYYDQFTTHNAHYLKHEVDLLNMLNSLYLTDIQMNSLILVATKMERIKQKHSYAEIAKLSKTLEAGYIQLRKRAMSGESVTVCDLPDVCKEANKKLQEIANEVHCKRMEAQAQVKAVLTENQLEKIYNYQHCLIPVKDLKDPTRIGQADASSVNEKMLKRVHALSDSEFKAELPKLIDCHIKAIEKKCGEMPKEDRITEGERFKSVLASSRKLSDLDFEFNRAKLGVELSSEYHEVKDRMLHVNMRLAKVNHEQGSDNLDVVGNMFLSPSMLHILAKRANINKGFKGTEAVDLDKIEGAAKAAGGCAID